MKYTNKHIKEQYKFNQILRTIGIIFLLIGIFLVGFGLIQTKRKMDYVRPFEQVLQEESHPANQTAYIEIIQVPEKLAENKYEGYYLVTTAEESYIVGMQPEQFAYLTKSFLVSVYGGKLTALDLAKVQKTRLFETVKGSLSVITLEVTTTEQEKITVSETEWPFFTMNEEEITYLTDVFGKRNIEFVCEIQPDEEIDEEEEF